MHETEQDLEELQALLDRSHARAGAHLRRIFSDERRVPAAALGERLAGIQVLHLATVNSRCEPRVAPVDGHFYRGRLWFGSAADSARFRNIRARPQVSATVTHGESFAVVVHGRAVEVDLAGGGDPGFRDHLLDAYSGDWDPLGGGATYARIEPDTMFTFGGAGE